MLYYKTIDTKLLELLKELMSINEFNSLRLVGGTALALQLGHRKSVDIDLFGNYRDDIDFLRLLSFTGKKVSWIKRSPNINIFEINNIKIDFVNYNYPWIDKLIKKDHLRLASIEDIAAMKINAITGRGAKKDFIDLYFLLKKYSLQDIFGFYQKKYNNNDLILPLKSITYFEDADREETPEMIKQVKWDQVKNSIKRHVEEYIRKL